MIVNTDAFDERNLEKAGYDTDPLEDDTLTSYRVIRIPMERLTKDAVDGTVVQHLTEDNPESWAGATSQKD